MTSRLSFQLLTVTYLFQWYLMGNFGCKVRHNRLCDKDNPMCFNHFGSSPVVALTVGTVDRHPASLEPAHLLSVKRTFCLHCAEISRILLASNSFMGLLPLAVTREVTKEVTAAQ